MTRPRHRLLLLAVSLGLLATTAASPALAGPRSWTQVTPAATTSATDEMGLVRTGDGTLFAAWRRKNRQDNEDLLVTAFDRAGQQGAPVIVQSNWALIGNPALVTADRRGIVAVWGGLRSLTPGDPYDGLVSATSSDRRSWTLQGAGAAENTGLAAGAPVSALAASPGGIYSAYYATQGVFVRAGLGAGAEPPNYLRNAKCCYYNPTLAMDGRSARRFVAWDSNQTGLPGRYTQEVGIDGQPVGAAAVAPGSFTVYSGVPSFVQPGSSAAITGLRGRPGVFTAYAQGYPSSTRRVAWRLGSRRPVTIARLRGVAISSVAVAADSGGRLWVSWADQAPSGGLRWYGRRSNRGATRWGATVNVGLPRRDVISVYRSNTAAGAGGLDVFVNVNVGFTSQVAIYHRRILPGFSVQPSVNRRRRTVTILVRDAGTPIRGARVRLGGRTARTDRTGRATLALPRGANVAVITATGYGPGRTRVVG